MAASPAAHELLCRWVKQAGMSQAKLAYRLGVSRTAVSKWCSGQLTPTPERAELIERRSEGAVPATAWPRRPTRVPATPGALLLRQCARERGTTLVGMARETGLPKRALARWANGESRPRGAGIAAINASLGLGLTAGDFLVRG